MDVTYQNNNYRYDEPLAGANQRSEHCSLAHRSRGTHRLDTAVNLPRNMQKSLQKIKEKETQSSTDKSATYQRSKSSGYFSNIKSRICTRQDEKFLTHVPKTDRRQRSISVASKYAFGTRLIEEVPASIQRAG